ncbi:MAG: DUF3380 domain-containing protein, partial [Alphaproteobacteria bacterium]
MRFHGRGYPMTEDGARRAREIVRLDAAHFWAFLGGGSNGFGFLPDRRPAIAFERHVFHRLTGGKFSSRHPDISHPVPGGYGAGGAFQYVRLERALNLEAGAALESTAWGMGQVMGFNARHAGFANAEEMIEAMRDSEDEQALAAVRLLAAKQLADCLRRAQWARFSRAYRGDASGASGYAIRLKQQFDHCERRPAPDLRVRAAQACLLYLGFDPGVIDGDFGDVTRQALIAYQAS